VSARQTLVLESDGGSDHAQAASSELTASVVL
jgi:hypothetical protein